MRSIGPCVLGLALFVVSGRAAASTPSFPSGTLLVDDDGKECPNAQFTSIQAAVDAANAGAIVGVCPGHYTGDVHVDKTLRLLGARHGVDGRDRTLESSGESVVVSDRPFTLAADDVLLDGFTILVEPDTSGEGWGVLTSGEHSGYRIVNNVMDADGVTAVFPGSSGATVTTIRRNHFYDRLGVATSGDEPVAIARNVRVVDDDFTESSLLLGSAEDQDVFVGRNRFEGGGTVIVSGATGVVVRSNELHDPGPEAIDVGSSAGVLVIDNVVRDAEQDGVRVTGDNDHVVVRLNRIAETSGACILLFQASGVGVIENEVEDSDAGIAVVESHDNAILRNDVEDNDAYGIRLGVGSVHNHIEGNEVRGNGPPDCLDQTQGDGTAGTANVWVDNEGSTSSPPGLCVDSP